MKKTKLRETLCVVVVLISVHRIAHLSKASFVDIMQEIEETTRAPSLSVA